MLEAVRALQEQMESQGYITDQAIATTVYLAMTLRKPVLIEGQAGVGKTEVAKVLSRMLETDLIRLQCYEGLDANTALYEWNYPKQMLRIKMEEGHARSPRETEQVIFSEAFLLKRPLLLAITHPDKAPVLLIDEIDRADEEFEAFLLEVLSDFQVTVPELGTIRATHIPYVVLTSNRTRELSDALRRRCLYLWIDYPSFEKEVRIALTRVPGINERLAKQICAFMEIVRQIRLMKTPGVAETLDWAMALMALHRDELDPDTVQETLGCVFKDNRDILKLRGGPINLIVSELTRAPEDQLARCSTAIVQRLQKELTPADL
ncbi:MAG TPA: MoxR family ATPase [Chloroflexota bacterium]|nr:MoxR family ATPase [Chloroflexota bacterium]HZU04388.1 MoxR family ATPase [Chloroflexota bacterium]